MMRGATRPGGEQGHAVVGAAGETVDRRGLEGLGEGHRRQAGEESACPYPGENPTLSCASTSAGLPNNLLSFHDAEPQVLPVAD
jgi:hypothetical protein